MERRNAEARAQSLPKPARVALWRAAPPRRNVAVTGDWKTIAMLVDRGIVGKPLMREADGTHMKGAQRRAFLTPKGRAYARAVRAVCFSDGDFMPLDDLDPELRKLLLGI